MKTILFGLLLAVSAAFVSAQITQTAFFYTSSPNSYMGAGKTEAFRVEDGWVFNLEPSAYQDPYSSYVWFRLERNVVGETRRFTSITIESPLGETISAGDCRFLI